MLASIYYFVGLFLLLLNLVLFFNIKKYFLLKEFLKKFKKVTQSEPDLKDFPEKTHEIISLIIVVEFCNFFWAFVGLISANWIIFLIYLLSVPILSTFINVSKITVLTNFLILSKLIITIFTLTLLVFNHFHFNLNLNNLILH